MAKIIQFYKLGILNGDTVLNQPKVLLNAMLKNLPEIIIFALDCNYCYTSFNQQHSDTIKQIWGKDISIGQCMLDVIGDHSDRIKAKENFDRALGGETFVLHEEYGDEKISRRYWEDVWAPVYNELNIISGLTCIVRDITNQTKNRIELQDSELKLDLFFNQTLSGALLVMLPEPIVWNETIDKEKVMDDVFKTQRITRVNDAYLDQYGFSLEEALSITPEISFSHDMQQCRDAWMMLFDEGYLKVETHEVRKDKQLIWIEGEYVCLYDDQKRIIGHFGIQQDITERKNVTTNLLQSHDMLNTIIQNDRNGVVVLDLNLNFIYVSSKFLQDFKIKDISVIGKSFYQYLPNVHHEIHQNVLKGEIISNDEDIFIQNDGTKDYVSWEYRPWYENSDVIGGLILYIEIITEKVTLTQTLNEFSEQLSALFDQAAIGISFGPYNKNYIKVNDKFCEIVGYSRTELQHLNYKDITHPDDLTIDQNLNARLFKGEISKYNIEKRYVRKDKSIVWVNMTTSSVHHVRTNQYFILVIIEDITARKLTEEKMNYLSYHDQLTGLYNRRFYEEELKRLDNRRNYPLALIMADMNGLKLINDAFGHTMGDTLLIEAAKSFKDVCRQDEIIARIGGDEFILLLTKATEENVCNVIERINTSLSNKKVDHINLSMACGYALKYDESHELKDVFKAAEDMMYRQKLTDSSSIMSKTIDIIMNSLYEKSQREMLHSRRVGELCAFIATRLNFDNSEINKMRVAGLMHDIGKIGITDTILNKEGSLTQSEYSDIQRHCEVGYRILSSANEFSEIAQFVLFHHEKWDGSGYPKKLKGDDIPLQSRIIAIADAYDAMTSDRSYRRAKTKQEAIIEIQKFSGSQFDPDIALIFTNPDNIDLL